MNHLLSVLCSNFMFVSLNDSWYVNLIWLGEFSIVFFTFNLAFIYYPSFTYYFSSHMILI